MFREKLMRRLSSMTTLLAATMLAGGLNAASAACPAAAG